MVSLCLALFQFLIGFVGVEPEITSDVEKVSVALGYCIIKYNN